MPDPLLFAKAVIVAGIASVGATLAVAYLTAVVFRKFGWRESVAGTSRIGIAVVSGIGLGAATGLCILGDLPPRSLQGEFPHWTVDSVLDRFVVVVLPLAILVELIGGVTRFPRWPVWILRLSLAATAGRVLLHGSSYLTGAASDWPVAEVRFALGVAAVLLASHWILQTWLMQRRPGISVNLALSQSCLAGGLAVMLSGYANGGALGLPVGAALAGAAIASALLAAPAANLGGLGIGLVGLFGILMMGRFFGELSTGRALALFLAPLLCWVSEMPILCKRRSWLIAAVRLALVAVPLVIVLGLAKRDFDRDNAEAARNAVPDRRIEARPSDRAAADSGGRRGRHERAASVDSTCRDGYGDVLNVLYVVRLIEVSTGGVDRHVPY
jgi:hypothetical protein